MLDTYTKANQYLYSPIAYLKSLKKLANIKLNIYCQLYCIIKILFFIKLKELYHI